MTSDSSASFVPQNQTNAPTQFLVSPETTIADAQQGTGYASNTVTSENFLNNETHVIQGLRTGTQARAQINFGGLVASGVPGWSPDLGEWGFGTGDDTRALSIYANSGPSEYSTHVPSSE